MDEDFLAEVTASLSETKRYNRSDAGNAEMFADHVDFLTWDPIRQDWYDWKPEQHRWAVVDEAELTTIGIKLARKRREMALHLSTEVRGAEERFALSSENANRIKNMLQLSRGLLKATAPWDMNPMLLGSPTGVIDLTTGELRDGQPLDCITQHCGIAFDPEAECPRWNRFILEIFKGDEALAKFVQRCVGYSLSGSTKEQVFCFCHGQGSNGKSTFLKICKMVAGAYGYTAPMSAFLHQQNQGVPNDVAALMGKRFVTASETSEDTRLNEARLKSLTGGEEISARFLHREFFQFNPVCKLWLGFNHRPVVKDDSFGFWRRARLIPFENTFDPNAEPDLEQKLIAELPGILNWAIRGCLEWQQEGLRAPSAVQIATQEYQEDSDVLADFLMQCAVITDMPGVEEKASTLFNAYWEWAATQHVGERFRMTTTSFGRRMSVKFKRVKRMDAYYYQGVVLKS